MSLIEINWSWIGRERVFMKSPLKKRLKMVIAQDMSNLLILIAVNPLVKLAVEKLMMTMNILPSFKGKHCEYIQVE